MISNINPTLFPLSKLAKVLDIGSADGANSFAMKKLGCEVSAIEIDPVLVERFKNNPNSDGIDIRTGDARKMPFSDNMFDAAILIEVIEHIPETEGLLEEIYRVLKPGGVLCIGVPTAYTEHLYWRLHPNYASNATHVRIFKKKDLTLLLESAGFRIKSVETHNFVPAVSWIFHSLLRSKSDHTGTIHSHLWIDRSLNSFFEGWGKTPVARKVLAKISRTIGKSWYIYCEKSA